MKPLRIGFIVSGGGYMLRQVLRSLAQAVGSVVAVVSHRECGALVAATEHLIPWTCDCASPTQLAYYANRVDVWVTAYDRLLTPEQIAAARVPILNVHPSLLPAFPGLHAVRQALAAGVRVVGATIHVVDAGMDTGPIVEQRGFYIGQLDNEREIAESILHLGAEVLTHEVFPAMAGGRLRFVDGRPVWER